MKGPSLLPYIGNKNCDVSRFLPFEDKGCVWKIFNRTHCGIQCSPYIPMESHASDSNRGSRHMCKGSHTSRRAFLAGARSPHTCIGSHPFPTRRGTGLHILLYVPTKLYQLPYYNPHFSCQPTNHNIFHTNIKWNTTCSMQSNDHREHYVVFKRVVWFLIHGIEKK